MLKRIHPIAGGIGLLLILTFWTATAASELFGSRAMVVAVKQAIPWGFFILVPALALTGASGFAMGAKWKGARIAAKKRRMPFIAGNGILILMPAAIYLSVLVSRGEFGMIFYVVQTIELIAGGTNIVLMALNMRDGLVLGRRP